MDFIFKKLLSNPKRFFDILPQDWQDEIVPFWSAYEDSSSIYIIEEKDQIIGGGIVFSTCPPDIEYYSKEAQQWFDKDYLYLGFIFILENKRDQNLGTFWLDELKTLFPKQKYWLLMEDEDLHRFYQKNAFMLNQTIGNNHLERVYIFKPLTDYISNT